MAGWIKIHRDIAGHWIFQDECKFKWWVDLLLRASYEDSKVLVGDRLVEVKRGQQIISLDFLSKRWNKAKGTVLKFLELLESDNMIERITDRKVTILTICNYESYQEGESEVVTDVCTDSLPMSDRCVTEVKKLKEIKENNNNISNACAREEKVPWNEEREAGFCERFKAQGCGMTMSRATGKRAADIMRMLDVFMAKCQLRNQGHNDFDHFNNRFLWAIQNNKLDMPQEATQKRVTGNEETYRLMQEMGWQR